MTIFGVPSQLDAAACKPECSTQCTASVRVNAFQKATLGSPLPGSWAPTSGCVQVIHDRHPYCQLPGSMTIEKPCRTADVNPHITRTPVVYQAQASLHHALCFGRMPGVLAHAPRCLCACQGQDERAFLWLVKLPGSCHSHAVRSQGGSIGPCDHSPLSESSGELSGNSFPSALPVCLVGCTKGFQWVLSLGLLHVPCETYSQRACVSQKP